MPDMNDLPPPIRPPDTAPTPAAPGLIPTDQLASFARIAGGILASWLIKQGVVDSSSGLNAETLAGLLVALATAGWTIYQNRQRRTAVAVADHAITLALAASPETPVAAIKAEAKAQVKAAAIEPPAA